jgi:hypothetical protein
VKKMAQTLCLGLFLTFLAAPSSLSALVDKALRLDGVDDFVETPDTPALHGEMPLEDLAMGVFFDVGSAWFADDAQNPIDRLDYLVSQPGRVEEELDLKKSFGFGVEMGDTRL